MKNTLKILILFILSFLFGCKPETKNLKTSDNKNLTVERNDFLSKKQIDSTEISKNFRYKGNFKNGLFWKDNSGENIVFITETGIFKNTNKDAEFEDGINAEVYAYSFKIENEKYHLNWKIYDYISDCPVDVVAEFIKNTLKITDLNKNGIAEIWVMYKTVCHGDVSPLDLKIIMYEGRKKFAMRGESRVNIGIDEKGNQNYIGGEYEYDSNFQQAPKTFKNFALKLWNDNVNENQ